MYTWCSSEGTLSRCEISTPKDKGLCDQLIDLLSDEGRKAILSVDNSPGVLSQNWLPVLLTYPGLLEVTSVAIVHMGLYTSDIGWGW